MSLIKSLDWRGFIWRAVLKLALTLNDMFLFTVASVAFVQMPKPFGSTTHDMFLYGISMTLAFIVVPCVPYSAMRYFSKSAMPAEYASWGLYRLVVNGIFYAAVVHALLRAYHEMPTFSASSDYMSMVFSGVYIVMALFWLAHIMPMVFAELMRWLSNPAQKMAELRTETRLPV